MQSLHALQTELSRPCNALCGVHVVHVLPAQEPASRRATLVQGSPVVSCCLEVQTVTVSTIELKRPLIMTSKRTEERCVSACNHSVVIRVC